jgi:hypothetical protein
LYWHHRVRGAKEKDGGTWPPPFKISAAFEAVMLKPGTTIVNQQLSLDRPHFQSAIAN